MLRRSRLIAQTAVELVVGIARGPRWWLLPFVFVLGVTALALLFVTAFEYAAPFVYTVF